MTTNLPTAASHPFYTRPNQLLREFLGAGLDSAPPDHSTISRTRRLIDPDSDRFVQEKLRLELLEAPSVPAGIAPGYDHIYYFISKFIPEHVAWHAERLRRE